MNNFILRTALITSLVVSSLVVNAQEKVDKMYSNFSGKSGFTVVGFSNNNLIKDLSLIIDDEMKEAICNIDRFKLLSYNDYKGDLPAEEVFDRIEKTFSSDKYFEIDPDSLSSDNHVYYNDGDDENLILFGHGTKKHLSEFHLISREGGHVVLLSFYGDVDFKDLQGCVRFKGSIGKYSIDISSDKDRW